MSRPDHVVLAGHTGRLLARVGLTADTEWETDVHIVKTVIAATRDLGRPLTGAEAHDLWEAAHTIYGQLHPAELQHLEDRLHRIGRTYARAQADIEAALARHNARQDELAGLGVLRLIAAGAPSYAADVLPAWLTDPSPTGVLDELEEVWKW